ncbi:MAG: hypothetical protein PHS18_08910, partial [Sphaerochaetaceae bacterium]|nr:hypothetical protein [Sphaerochaetaceae bacterium]
EFQNKYSAFELCNQISKRELDKLKQFLSKAIDQTREETIREVEEMLPKERVIVNDDFHPAEDADYCKGDVSHAYNSAIKQIKQSLKSLINK